MNVLIYFFKAGQRAAIEVMDDLRPQCLSSKDYILLKKSSSQADDTGAEMMKAYNNGGVFEELWFSNVFRWTLVMPFASLCVVYSVFKLRETYSHLLNTYR